MPIRVNSFLDSIHSLSTGPKNYFTRKRRDFLRLRDRQWYGGPQKDPLRSVAKALMPLADCR
jgi:hypothetical protein